MQPPNQRGQCARHPERVAEAVCPRCGNFTCTECNPDGLTQCPACLALGGTGQKAERTPWERRDELGFAPALFATWKASLLEPAKFFASVDPDAPMGDAIFYGWLVASVAAVLQIPLTWLNFAQMNSTLDKLSSMGSNTAPLRELMTQFAGMPLIFAIGVGVFSIMAYPIGLIIGAGFAHLGGLMFGASDKGFNATVRAFSYAQGPQLFGFIPVVGGLAGLWTLVLEIWAFKEAQRTTWPKAVASIGWIVLIGCCCGLIAAIAIGVAASKNL